MRPWYSTVRGFEDVAIKEEGVDTEAYLEATDGLTHMFELLGSPICGFVQKKIRDNVSTVRARFEKFPEESSTLEMIVRSCGAGGPASIEVLVSLEKLIRGQFFTSSSLLHAIRDPADELRPCFQRGYNEVLAPHHNFLLRGTVAVGLRALPSRADFFGRISAGAPLEDLNAALEKSLTALQVIVKRIRPSLPQPNAHL